MTASDSTNVATVRFHRDLYADEAVDEAVAIFADYAKFSTRSDGEHYVVDVRDLDGEVEGDVVAEFCNFALANSATRRKGEDA